MGQESRREKRVKGCETERDHKYIKMLLVDP